MLLTYAGQPKEQHLCSFFSYTALTNDVWALIGIGSKEAQRRQRVLLSSALHLISPKIVEHRKIVLLIGRFTLNVLLLGLCLAR